MNALFRDDAVHEYASAHVGLAVASPRGLTVPVIHGADALSLEQIAEKRRLLVEKVRAGSITVSEVVGGTFTVSNLGMFDVKQFTAIINPPQVAILAVGSTRTCHVWNDGAPEWRQISEFTLTCDHRAVDGALAARFMGMLKDILEGRDD
jgi:pyruvate dehydrogenase E2 component (dihydrolipoamide acetyltransferase)